MSNEQQFGYLYVNAQDLDDKKSRKDLWAESFDLDKSKLVTLVLERQTTIDYYELTETIWETKLDESLGRYWALKINDSYVHAVFSLERLTPLKIALDLSLKFKRISYRTLELREFLKKILASSVSKDHKRELIIDFVNSMIHDEIEKFNIMINSSEAYIKRLNQIEEQ